MKITNLHNVPATLLALASKEYYSKGQAEYSVTELIGPPRIRRLREEHEASMTQDVSEMLWQMIGSALHVVMERGTAPGCINEERITTKIVGTTISGQIDLQEMTDQGLILIDYKFTSSYAFRMEKPEWEHQLNFYRWLVEREKGRTVAGLKVCALIRDFSRHDIGRDGYPLAPIQMIDIPMWTMDKAKDFVHDRLLLHQDAKFNHAFGDPLPECSKEERWETDTTYAVKRKGRKTAIRVLGDLNEATELAGKEKDAYVETRTGEPRRCTGNYCGVRDFCSQWSGYVADVKRQRACGYEGAAEALVPELGVGMGGSPES